MKVVITGVSGFLGAGVVVVDARRVFTGGVEGMGFYYRTL